MIKIEKNKLKSVKNHIFFGVNIIIIFNICVCGVGCIDSDTKGIAGSYYDGSTYTLDVYDNHTYTCTRIVGYFRDTEVTQTVTGTWTRDKDMVVFTGDCVVTTAYIQGDMLVTEERKYVLLQ